MQKVITMDFLHDLNGNFKLLLQVPSISSVQNFSFSLQARHFFHLEDALEVAGPSKTPPKKNVDKRG